MVRRLTVLLAVAVPALAAAQGNPADGWVKMRAWAGGAEIGGEPAGPPQGTPESRITRGQELFGPYCARCHGNDGKGGGAAGQGLSPPPGNLAEGVAKFRSTPRETKATELDLFRTITRGLHGTAMPSFADLSEPDRWALATYARSLGKVPEGKPVAIPPVPADMDSPERVGRGAAVFVKLGCNACHGDKGRGDGPVSKALFGADGKPLHVLNFTADTPKRGRRPEAIFTSLVTGVGRTPMPGFDAASPGDLWDVISFVRSRLPREGTVTGPQEQAGMTEIVNACQPPAPPAGK